MSSKQKNIYSFDVFVPRSVTEEEVTQGEGGEEIVTRKKVEKKVPVNIVIREPGRRTIEDADNFYTKEVNRLMREGYLTRSMVGKLYEDGGGALSESRVKDLQNRFTEIPNFEKECQILDEAAKVAKEKGDEEAEKDAVDKAKVVREKIAKLHEEFTSIQSQLNSLYEFTAETKALNAHIRWYMLFLTYVNDGGIEKPMFAGKDYKEKNESDYALSDAKDVVYELAQSKIAGVIAYWFFRKEVTKEELDNIVLKIDKGEF